MNDNDITVDEMIKNPYKDINLSLLVPCKDFDSFLVFYKTLIEHGPKKCDDVELIVKVDKDEDVSPYYELLSNSTFHYKILLYPTYYARHSLHHFFNDMFRISSGKIIWILTEDLKVVKGNWYTSLMKTRNCFKDNIYYICVPMNNGKGSKQIVSAPAVTREWCNATGCVSEMPNADRWLYELSKKVNRCVKLDESELLIEVPKGRRILSKAARKKYFYPLLDKIVKKLKKKI